MRKSYLDYENILDRFLVARWPNTGTVGENWGDKLNPVLIKLLSGKDVLHQDEVPVVLDVPVHLVIGSGLQTMDSRNVVWGMGFISSKRSPSGMPRCVNAVRGPLSRKRLIEHGIECPEVYGDPALLCPLFFPQSSHKRYDLGLILHHREVGVEPIPTFPPDVSVKLISVTDTIEGFLADICSCRQILSSSLHGIIAAHAYGVPASWLKLSNLPIGDDFKFRDYFSSIGVDDVEPFIREECETFAQRKLSASNVKISLGELISACPFIPAARKSELIRNLQAVLPTGLKPKSAHRVKQTVSSPIESSIICETASAERLPRKACLPRSNAFGKTQ